MKKALVALSIVLLVACSPASADTADAPTQKKEVTTTTEFTPDPSDVKKLQDELDRQAFEKYLFLKYLSTTTTTTTTTVPVTTTTAAPVVENTVPQAPAPAQPVSGSGACGGDLPPCYVMMRESGGNITAQNPSSTASGKWQFLDSTWAGYGGYAKARYAPESVQDAKARELWAGGAGCSHWSAC